MLKYLPVLLLAVCSNALIFPKPINDDKGARIIGGGLANQRTYSWQAALFISTTNGLYFCSGTLVSTLHVITTGSCLESDVTEVEIHLGTPFSNKLEYDVNRRVLASDNIILHPDFDANVFQNDIAFVQFRQKIGLTDYIHAAYITNDVLQDGASVTVSGWGQTSDDVEAPVEQLGFVQLVTISNQECQSIYGGIINENIVCAVGNYNEGTCNGDTGAPLASYAGYRPQVAAIANFISANGCETPDPSGFIRIQPYYQWIRGVIDAAQK